MEQPTTKLAYERTAPFYDALTAHHDYERWPPRLVVLAKRHGLHGMRLLDVGCGTGKSFLALLRAGWDVTGCDLSPAMLRRARSKAAGRARLELTDMRDLPRFGSFDLVWSLGDVVNHLLDAVELQRCMAGMARNLAPGGRVLFDTSTLHTFRTFYAATEVHERGRWRLTWRGHGDSNAPAGSGSAATLEVVAIDDGAAVSSAVHRERHFRPEEVAEAMRGAGLECLAIYGHGCDGCFERPLDEGRHTKAIFIGRRSEGR